MNKCVVYEENLKRVLNGCPFLLNGPLKEGFYNYFLKQGIDLNCLNVDDVVIYCDSLTEEEYKEVEERVVLIAKENNNYWVISSKKLKELIK